jgi:hypothetical protein
MMLLNLSVTSYKISLINIQFDYSSLGEKLGANRYARYRRMLTLHGSNVGTLDVVIEFSDLLL